ncbi:MAG: hypothetical protein ABL962_02715 [Fimbriimonadaceae bacterium]
MTAIPQSCIVETPATLAEAIVSAVKMDEACWMDPCVGLGAFTDAIVALSVNPKIHAIDIRPIPNKTSGAQYVVADYMEAIPVACKPNIIVANPPYVPISRLATDLANRALSIEYEGLRVGGMSSYWLPFLLQSLNTLQKGGNLGFVLPASFEYADYAKELRERIPKLFKHFEIHRSRKPLFPAVSDGCVVVLGFGFRDRHVSSVRFEHSSLQTLVQQLRSAKHTLARRVVNERSFQGRTIREVAEIGIGAVTGDSSFFLLSQTTRKALKIAEADCVPAVTRSAQVRSAVLSGVTKATLRDDDRCLIFLPRCEKLRSVGANRYIRAGERGLCALENFKVKHRDPWHTCDLPMNPHGVITGMFSRFPSVALLESGITLSNTLYWFRLKGPSYWEDRMKFALSFFCTEAAEAVQRNLKRYPDGLLKLEPGQILALPYCALKPDHLPEELLVQVRQLVRAGEYAAASRIVDSLRA